MAFDSTADLLFRIGADSSDAEANLARFRALLSGGLGAMREDFSDFAGSTFGNFSTVAGAATSSAALLLTGVVAAGGAALECAHKYSALVEQIEHGSRITQIGAEHLSGLYVAAQLTGTNFETLTRGVAFFEAQISKANSGNEQSRKIFDQLHISQAQLAAGEKDAIPLLELVAQRYAALSSGAEKVAVARALFSRAGIEDQAVLALLAQGMKTLEDRAREMGVMVGEKDILAFEGNRAALARLRMELSAAANAIGREVLPEITKLVTLVIAFPAALRKTAEESANAGSVIKGTLLGALGPLGLLIDGLGRTKQFADNLGHAGFLVGEEIKKMAAVMGAAGDNTLHLGGATAVATHEYDALRGVLERVREKLAAFQGDEVKAREEISALGIEIEKAQKKLNEQHAAGTLAPGEYDREMAAWKELADLVPRLYDQMLAEIDKKRTAEIDRWNEDLVKSDQEWLRSLVENAHREVEAEDALRARLATFHAQTLEEKHAAADAEIERMREEYAKQNNLTQEASTEELALLAKLRAEKHAKIDADAKLAADTELAQLGEQLERIEKSHQNAYERIADQYQADVAKFSAAEEKKALIVATSEAERAAIQAKFAAIRTALYVKEQQDLQNLKNSTGWKGVFGDDFAESIRRNTILTQQWADSTDRSLLLVRVAIESAKEQLQDFVHAEVQAMGAAIAQSLVYSKSIGAAMEAATKSTLESICAKDMVLAIDALGWGFYDLAVGNYPGAASAFEAAAIFGSIAGAAGVAGRFIPGGQSSASRGGSGAGSSLPSNTSSRERDMQSGAVGAPAAGGGSHVSVTIMGHVIGTSGVSELCSMLNDAVLNGDNTLTATNTKTGVQVQQ
jgi:hypothetical protein